MLFGKLPKLNNRITEFATSIFRSNANSLNCHFAQVRIAQLRFAQVRTTRQHYPSVATSYNLSLQTWVMAILHGNFEGFGHELPYLWEIA